MLIIFVCYTSGKCHLVLHGSASIFYVTIMYAMDKPNDIAIASLGFQIFPINLSPLTMLILGNLHVTDNTDLSTEQVCV